MLKRNPMPATLLYRRAHPAGAAVSEWRAADGATLRSFAWPAPANAARRGSILFQSGRGDMFEKYLELFAHWHARGWAVTAFDWRGQGGSARIGRHPLTGHVERFEDFLLDLEAFAGGWASEAALPQVVIGHSMGGHLVLRAMVERRLRPAAAVLVAPMLGLRSPLGQAGGGWLAGLMARLGDADRPAWRANETPLARAGRQELLTFDDSRYGDEIWWQEAQPHLVTGPPSWRWLAEAFASTRALARDPRLAATDVPVLGLVADADRLVDPAIALRVLGRLPRVEIERFGADTRHELLREADPVRGRAIALIDAFLDRHAPAVPA